MLQFQEILSIYKIEFWCGLTIAILIWGYRKGDRGGGGERGKGSQDFDFGSRFRIEFSICE